MLSLGRVFGILMLAMLAMLAGCGSSAPRGEETTEVGLPRAPVLALPADWRTSSPADFEAWILEALPEDQATPLAENSLRDLQRALDEVTTPLDGQRHDPLAVRAAAILGRSRYPSSATPLIRRLEARKLGAERYSDCGDTVAAAALARFPDPRRYAQRLVPLAVGARPHPDLEVRVECAATALHAGYPQGIPFLLQVLRIDTFAGEKDARDFAVSPTTAWARGRAAEALSAFAGVPLAYRFDGSIAHREEEAAKLEALLLPAPSAAEEAPMSR